MGAALLCCILFQASTGDSTARSSNGFFIHLAEPGLERLKAEGWAPLELLSRALMHMASPYGLAFHCTVLGSLGPQTQRECPKSQHSKTAKWKVYGLS